MGVACKGIYASMFLKYLKGFPVENPLSKADKVTNKLHSLFAKRKKIVLI